MECKIMVLPHSDFSRIRVVRMPADFEEHEAFRRAVGLIAQVEQDDPDADWDAISDALDAAGFETLPYLLGPELG